MAPRDFNSQAVDSRRQPVQVKRHMPARDTADLIPTVADDPMFNAKAHYQISYLN